MARKAASLPHPVVGVGDDAFGELSASTPDVDVSSQTTTISINELRCTNEAIDSLLNDGGAEFVVRIECGSTFFRRVWKTANHSLDISVGSGELQGTVEVTIDVAARRTLDSYRPTRLHADYGDASFTIETGSILATGLYFYFDVHDSFDPLSGNAASLFRIRSNETDDEPMSVVCDAENHVIIKLSKSELTQYEKVKQHHVGVIHTGLVFPALIEAINSLRSSDQQALLPWQLRLRQILDDAAIGDETSAITAASIVLKRPFYRAATHVLAKMDESNE